MDASDLEQNDYLDEKHSSRLIPGAIVIISRKRSLMSFLQPSLTCMFVHNLVRMVKIIMLNRYVILQRV